jgi:hypothetical protein
MKNNILNELGDSSFDKDKWQWNDTKRINEQEKRITQLIVESNEHKDVAYELGKAIISLSKEVETLRGQSRWIDSDDCKTIHVPSCPHHWVKEEFHDD